MLAQSLPEAQEFWRRYPRMCTLPPRAIEYASTHAIMTSFESVTDQARIDVITARDTCEVLGLERSMSA